MNNRLNDMDLERQAYEAVRVFAKNNKELLMVIARQGDGYGGQIAKLICEEIGLEKSTNKALYSRPKISSLKRKSVFLAYGKNA